MGLITDYLRSVIVRQVDEHRMVVWFDPEKHYADAVQSLDLADTHLACYDGSFLALRHQIEPLIGSDEPPRLVVYVPMSEEDTRAALIELTSAGVVLKPGQSSVQRNTRLSVLARRALKDVRGTEELDDLVKQVDAGKLSVGDLDRLADACETPSVIEPIFKTAIARDVALAFLSSDRYDADIAARDAVDDVRGLFVRAFEADLPPGTTCKELRERLARHVLTTEFIASIQPPLPQALGTVKLPATPMAREACIDLVRTWRLRRDHQESYAASAARVETGLGLAGIPFEPAQLRTSETFERVEHVLQEAAETALLDALRPDMIDIAQERQTSFWSEWDPEVQSRWALIVVAGQLLQEAARIETELKTVAKEPGALLRAYAGGDRPWCQIDTHQRNLERRWHLFDFGIEAQHRSLERLITRARQRYMEVGGTLAEHYVHTLADSKFAVDLPRQRAIYTERVAPALKRGKAAYVLVDALRFEMARELMASFEEPYGAEIGLAVGTVPTITPIGMASLMPGAETGARVVPAGAGALGLEVGGTVLATRDARIEWLRQRQPGRVVVARLGQMLPKPKKALHDDLKAADLILITSQEIDEAGEKGDAWGARKAMDDVLPELSRLVNKLREYGCATIVITADHGYVFGEELDSDMKIDPPGGQTVDLHRRVWVGTGGSADPAFLRAPLAALGLGGDLEIAVPWGFGVFKAPGSARAYVHGGMSPQEMAILVLTLRPIGGAQAASGAEVEWKLAPGSKKISTRFFTVQITGQAIDLLQIEPPRVRVEVRAKNDVLSQPVASSYGYVEATGDVELRVTANSAQLVDPNTVTLMLMSTEYKGMVSVHLLDAVTGRELAVLPAIEMSIAL